MKSHFGLLFIHGKSNVDKNWHGQVTFTYKQACRGVLELLQNLTHTSEGQRSNLTQNLVKS